MQTIKKDKYGVYTIEPSSDRRLALLAPLVLGVCLLGLSELNEASLWLSGMLGVTFLGGSLVRRRTDRWVRIDTAAGTFSYQRPGRDEVSGSIDRDSYLEVVREPAFRDPDAWAINLIAGTNGEVAVPLLSNRSAEYARSVASDIGESLGVGVVDRSILSVPADTDSWQRHDGALHSMMAQEVTEEFLSREMNELARRSKERPENWQSILSIDRIVRSDDEELRVTRPVSAPLRGIVLLASSVATIAVCNWLRISNVIKSPFDHELMVFLTGIVGLLAVAAGLFSLRIMRPSWVSIRKNDKTIRGRLGWFYRFQMGTEDVKYLAVENIRGHLGTSGWVISIKRNRKLIHIATTAAGRDARILAEALSRRLEVQILDLSGALPPLGKSEGSARREHGPKAQDTPEQLAARNQIDEIIRTRGRSIVLWRAATVAASLTGTVLPLYSAIALPPPTDVGRWILSLMPYVVVEMICLAGWYRAQSRMGTEFEKVDSVAAVGPLLDLVGESSGSQSAGAQRSLANLLKLLRPSDRTTLSENQRATLRGLLTPGRMLKMWSRAGLVRNVQISALQALEQIGDDRDIPAVESMLSNAGEGLRKEIAYCLESLYHRGDANRSGSTLLRPFETAAGMEALLRPAAAENTSDIGKLLHVSDEDEPRVFAEAASVEATAEVRA